MAQHLKSIYPQCDDRKIIQAVPYLASYIQNIEQCNRIMIMHNIRIQEEEIKESEFEEHAERLQEVVKNFEYVPRREKQLSENFEFFYENEIGPHLDDETVPMEIDSTSCESRVYRKIQRTINRGSELPTP